MGLVWGDRGGRWRRIRPYYRGCCGCLTTGARRGVSSQSGGLNIPLVSSLGCRSVRYRIGSGILFRVGRRFELAGGAYQCH